MFNGIQFAAFLRGTCENYNRRGTSRELAAYRENMSQARHVSKNSNLIIAFYNQTKEPFASH